MRVGRVARIYAHGWTLFPLMGPVEAARFAAGHRFQGLELHCNPLDFWPGMVDRAVLDELAAIRAGEGLEYSLYGCITANAAAVVPELRVLGDETMRWALDLAARLGCRILCVHPGEVDELGQLERKGVAFRTARFDREALVADGRRRAVEALGRWGQWAAPLGVTLVVENECHVPRTTAPGADVLASMLAAIGRSNVRANLDTGHAFIGGGLAEELQALEPYVAHVHLDDNRVPGVSEHLPLGEGAVDFPAIAGFLARVDAALALEIYAPDRPVEATLQSRDYLLRVLTSAHR